MNTVQIKKTGKAVEIDFANLPETSRAYLIDYGIRQALNDCHSDIQAKDFDSVDDFHNAVMSAVDQKLAALKDGTVNIRKSGVAKLPADPVEAEAVKMAREAIKTALATKGTTVKAIGPEKHAELVQAYLDKHGETVRKEARRRVKVASESVINLDELGI